MRTVLTALTLLALTMTTGCVTMTTREAWVLKMETQWFAKASLEQADLLEHFVRTHPDCKCNEAQTAFTNTKCQKAAKTLLTAKHRTPYHRDMALHNSGHLDERPPKTPPAIPPVSVLCDGGEVD